MLPIIMAGGLIVPPARAGELDRQALRKPSPAHGSWQSRADRWREGAGPYPGPEPGPWVECCGAIDSGPYQGGLWAPACAPGLPTPDVARRYRPAADYQGGSLTLRDYQAEALAEWQEWGCIVAPCGAGKTEIGCAAILRSQTPAIVLVHTHDLAEQWRERVRLRLGVDAGLVGGGKDQRDRPVVVALVQTLIRWSWWERYEWGRGFGLVVQDEAHHAPAATLAEVLCSLPCALRLGLTATPRRQDGLEDWIWWTCGPEVHRIEEGTLTDCGATLAPEVQIVRSPWVPTAEALAKGWTAAVSELVTDPDRNALLEDVARDMLDEGRVVLLLTDRVDHARQLAEALGGEALVGAVSAKRRADLLGRAREGSLRLVTATTVADEGLDLPRLDGVILACPSKNEARVQQRIGRALRPGDGKLTPVVADVVDAWGPLQGWARKRRSLYRRLGWGVVG